MSCHDQLSSVVFINILDIYPPNESLNCKFTVRDEGLQGFDELSWVGIFKVGWESLADCVSKQYLPTTGETEAGVVLFSNSTEEICFEGEEIPKESDEEFYQFCFITGKGAVLGASCPFQISHTAKSEGNLSSASLLDLSSTSTVEKTNDGSDLEWCPWLEVTGEDVDDTVFVHNKTTLLEKSLAKVIEENNCLRETIEQKEISIQNLHNELSEVQNQIHVTKDLLDDKRKQQISDIEQLDELQICMEEAKNVEQGLKKEIYGLNKTVQKLNRELEESYSRDEINLLSKQLAEADARGKEKCIDFENKLRQSVRAHAETESALEMEREITKELQFKHQEELHNLTQSFNSVLSELGSQNECVEHLRSENKLLNERLEHSHLTRDEEIRDLTDNILKKEHVIGDLEKQLECQRRENEERVTSMEEKIKECEDHIDSQRSEAMKMQDIVSKELESLKDENDVLRDGSQKAKDEALKAQGVIHVLQDKIKELNDENFLLREKSDGHNGARHALQVAYIHTQRQLAQIKGDRDIFAQQYNSLKQQSMGRETSDEVKELKKQIEDLKLRLCIGATAYKEKFLECKKFQKELTRLTLMMSERSSDEERTNQGVAASPADSDCKTRVLIPNRMMSNEHSSVNREGNSDMAKVGDEKIKKHAAHKIVQLQSDLEVKNTILRKMEMEHKKSLSQIVGELKLLQDIVRTKDALIEKFRSKEQAAEEEIKSLKEEMGKLQNPAKKFTRLHEQLFASSNIESSSVSKSVTSTPQQTTGTMNSSELNSDKRKIFLPPTSLTSNTGTTCFIEPYLLTQRPPVSVDQLPKAQGIQDSVTEPQGRKMFVTGSQGREMLAKEPKDKESQTPPRALHHPEAKSTIAVPDVFQSAPAFTCPVCDIIFPSDYSDVAATEHVNSHFTDAPSHGH